MVIVRPGYILLGLGGGQDNDRDRFELIVLLDRSEDVDAVHAREAQIQQDYMRAGILVMIGIFPPMEQIVQCRLSIEKVAYLVCDPMFLHGTNDEFCVICIIFDEHDEDRLSNHLGLLAEYA
jgi:hypothetical protein